MKIVRDLVHGYIELNDDDIRIIDTPHFQRLKRIRQMGFYSAYPCANHTRFEHSLGVMHLGIKALNAVKILDHKSITDSLEKTVRYACLLHDVGHAPFSHIGERFYYKEDLIRLVTAELKIINPSTKFCGKGAPNHELCSCYVILKHYRKILDTLNVDLELLCRMIVGEKYGKVTKKIQDSLISILNSNADVDKLDFVLRDSQMSGAKLVALDTDRLVSTYMFHNGDLAFSGKALSTVSNLIYGRDAVYNWIVNHHTSIYTNCIFERLIKNTIETNEERKKLFSHDAIMNNLIDDFDLISFIRTKKEKIPYCKELYDDLFNRKYFKTLWKTKFEYDRVIQTKNNQDKLKEKVKQFENSLEELEQIIFEKHSTKFSKGDFFICLAKFKPFTPVAGKEIYLVIDKKEEHFHDVFNEGIYKQPISELPFIFVRNEQIKNDFINLLNNPDEITSWDPPD